MRVAGNLGGAQPLERRLHLLPRTGRGAHQIDLIAFDRPAGEITRVVRNERVGGWKWFHGAQEAGVDAQRRRHEVIVEVVR